MIRTDEDALICDLAETYGIFNYKSLPLRAVATFAIGLKDDSRIKRKQQKQQYSPEILMMAVIVDRLSFIAWSHTKDGQRGKNAPEQILPKLLGIEQSGEIEAFDTPEQFWEARRRALAKV